MEAKTKENRDTKWKWLFLLALVLILISIVCYEGNTVYAELENLKLIPMQERFTELYFENPSFLPQRAFAGDPISFSFTIHNLEAVSTNYPYNIYFEGSNGQSVVFASSSVTLAENTSKTIDITYIFPIASTTRRIDGNKVILPSVNETGMVVVDLISLNQQIDFLLSGKNLQ